MRVGFSQPVIKSHQMSSICNMNNKWTTIAIGGRSEIPSSPRATFRFASASTIATQNATRPPAWPTIHMSGVANVGWKIVTDLQWIYIFLYFSSDMYYSIVTICYNVLHCISMSVGQDLPDSAKRLKANLQRWPSKSSNIQKDISQEFSGILSSQDIPNRLGHLLRCSKLCWFFNSMTSLLRGTALYYKIWKPWSEQRKAGKITDSNNQQIAAVYAVCTLLCWAFVAKVSFWPQPFPLSDPAANWCIDRFQNSGYKTKIKKTVHV